MAKTTMTKIYKAAGIIIKDRKLLITRTQGKTIFINPGGKLKESESYQQALVRELQEELGVITEETDFEELGTWEAEAAYDPGTLLSLTAFLVNDFKGEVKPQNEVEEIAWLTSENEFNFELSSILEHDILPLLVSKNMID